MIEPNSAPNSDSALRWAVVDRSADGTTFTLLASVFGHRIDGELIGCVITRTRAVVCWDSLEHSDRLSSSERAIACLARGCSMITRHGVRPDHGRLLVDSIAALALPVSTPIRSMDYEAGSGARHRTSGDTS